MGYEIGDWRTPTLTVTPHDGNTTATLTVYAPDGTTSTPTVSTQDTGATWTGVAYQVTAAGRWTEQWTVTGTGKGTQRATVDVVDPDASPLYASLEELRDALKVKNSVVDDDRMLKALRTASRAIDSHTSRPPGGFLPARTATARSFRIRGRRVSDDVDGPGLLVDDIATDTGLAVELPSGTTSWTAWTGWTAEPVGYGRPITVLRGQWPTTGLVRITARWGWPVLPEQISTATLIQATRLYKRPESPEGVTGSADWGVIRLARLDPDVAALTNFATLPGFA